MQYFIKRGEEQFGPYSLADLQLYVQKGNIAEGDLARSEAMDDWVPVGQVIGNIKASDAVAAQSGFGDGLPPLEADSPSNSKILGLHWGLLLLLTICTFGLFGIVWGFLQAAYVRRLRSDSKAIIYYAIGIAVLFIGVALRDDHSSGSFYSPEQLVCGVFKLVALFSMKESLEDYYSNEEDIGLTLSGVMVFFFGSIYLQYHFNRIRKWKTTGTLDP